MSERWVLLACGLGAGLSIGFMGGHAITSPSAEKVIIVQATTPRDSPSPRPLKRERIERLSTSVQPWQLSASVVWANGPLVTQVFDYFGTESECLRPRLDLDFLQSRKTLELRKRYT